MRRTGRRPDRGSIEDRERTIAAAICSLVGASMVVAGLLVVGHGSFADVAGATLLVLGAPALFQGVAIGLGLLPPAPGGRDDGPSGD